MKKVIVSVIVLAQAFACFAQNPIIRDQFSADPSALVVGDKVYVYPSHDIPAPDDYARKDWFCMADYHVFSSSDLVNWKDHGVILTQNSAEWINNKSYSMWAPDCKEHNGRYYFYYPALQKVSEGQRFGGYRIGVAIANKPEGPFRAMRQPIDGPAGIDPCIFVDDDGTGYLVWPQRGFVIAKLNDDWMTLSGERHTVENTPTKGLIEGPYLFKRGEYYYMTFPWARENTEVLAYCMAKNVFGPYEFKGVFFEEHSNGCWTNHHSIINFKDQWYIFYHHNSYSPHFDKNRSACIDSLFFNPDGTIQMVHPTLRGVGVADAHSQLQIDRYTSIAGGAHIEYLDTTNYFEGWKTVFPKKGASVTFNTVDFKDGVETVNVMVRAPKGGTLEILAPKAIASVKIPSTKDWKIVSVPVTNSPKGINNITATLKSTSNLQVDWISFDTTPYTQGGFETGKYRNYFLELGYSEKEVADKLQSVFDEVFSGPHKCYFEVGDSMAYISDIKNKDVRTEGMSYGMMIAVQFDRKDIFDRLWRWCKKYMQQQDGINKGYFAWTCKTDGTRNSQGPASDGELYYITSLIFASNRWGNDTGINYLAEAQYIINQSMAKAGMDRTGTLIDLNTQLITFTPGSTYTDPSYHLPAFYEVWAKWLYDGRSNFWKQCAEKSREYLHKSINPETGLNPDTNNFDGSPIRGFFGSPGAFRYDSWRVPMNIALDYSWSCADREWQQQYGNTIQIFLYSKGLKTFVDQYNVDGSTPQDTLRAGSFPKALRHSMGLVATSAAVSLCCTHAKSKEFVQQLWDTPHAPLEDGFFDEYYDGLLRLFAFMHLSGNYRVIENNFPPKEETQPQRGFWGWGN